ncbi:MAG TPA: amino acid permease [Candidatus Omnitrophota bacterium]|nr:amino acid permease [Candidatus Omnitrophota bacterium]
MSRERSGRLKRTLGLFSLAAYGVGDILGAGVYALIGTVAGMVGNACWMPFLLSLFVAALTGLSYAELGARYPRAGGEAHYTFRAFRRPLLSYALGFFVLMSGVNSMAVVSQAFAGYVRAIFPSIPGTGVVLLFLFALAVIVWKGMNESSMTNVVCTAVEVTGLLIVIFAGIRYVGKVDYFEFPPVLSMPSQKFFAIFQGSVLAFYAFIGFEDMVKAGEETRDPGKTIPRAIIISLAVVGLLYILTTLAVVSAVPYRELSESQAPLMLVVERGAPWMPKGVFGIIVLFAMTNTALVNFVMSSRLLYGMAGDRLVPRVLRVVHPKHRTPHIAVIVVFLIALVLAVTGTLKQLAQSTAVLLLVVFVFVNLSLLIVKLRKEKAPEKVFSVPSWIPVLGILFTLLLVLNASPAGFLTAGILLLISFLLFLLSQISYT